MRHGLVVSLLLVGLWIPSSGCASDPDQTHSPSVVTIVYQEVPTESRMDPEAAHDVGTFSHEPLIQIVPDSHVLFQWRPGSETILDDYWKFETRKGERLFGFWNSDRLRYPLSSGHYIIGDGSPPVTPESNPVWDSPNVFQYQPVVRTSPELHQTFAWSPEAMAIQRDREVARQRAQGLRGYGSRYAIERVSHFSYGSGPGGEDRVYSWGLPVHNSCGFPVLQVSSDGMIRREGEFFFPTE